MAYAVTMNELHKAYGDHVVLDGVDLTIEEGTVFGLLGANGAGKTTLVRILATLVGADSGEATVAGHDVRTDPVAVKRAISLTGQYAALDDVLTGRENLEMMAELRHLPRAAIAPRVAELLDAFDLTLAADRRAATYSGGMRRRLDLAISMIVRPQLLFLDEPTTGLDPRSREQLWATVAGIVDDGVTVLLTTQYLEEADQLAHRIGLLDGGRLVACGTADDLKSDLGPEVVRIQLADARDHSEAVATLERSHHPITRTDERLHHIDVTTSGTAAEVGELLALLTRAGCPATRVSTQRPSLDDVFRARTRPTLEVAR